MRSPTVIAGMYRLTSLTEEIDSLGLTLDIRLLDTRILHANLQVADTFGDRGRY